MKRIANILLWCAALLLTASTLCAQTSIITGTVRAPDGTPWQTSIEFLSKSTPVGIGTVTVPTKRLVTTATNGTFSVALFPGTYQTTIRGASGTTGWPDSVFYIFVSTNLGTYDITSVMTNKLVALYPSGLLTTKGDIYVYDGTNVNRLAAGASNQVLRVNPTTVTGLEYVDLASATVTGAVTSVGVTSAVTALTVTGSPITSSGNIGLSLHSNLVDWSAIPTNTLTGLGTGSGSVTNVTLAAPTGGGVLLNGAAGTNTITSGGTNSLVADWSAVASVTNLNSASNSILSSVAAGYQPLDADLTGWSQIGTNQLYPLNYGIGNVDTNDVATRDWVQGQGYVTAAVTNGLAGTNQIYRLIAGSNVTITTNSWDLTIAATSGGGVTNAISEVRSNGVAIVTGATVLDIINPSSLASNAGGVATLTLPTGGGSSTSITNIFNTTQFYVSGSGSVSNVSIKSGAVITNLSSQGTLTANAVKVTNGMTFIGTTGYFTIPPSNSAALTHPLSLWHDGLEPSAHLYFSQADAPLAVKLANYSDITGGGGITTNYAASGLWFAGPMTVTNSVFLRTNLTLYGGYTDDSNNESLTAKLTSTNVWSINAANIGTFTTARDVMFSMNGTNMVYLKNNGTQVGICMVPTSTTALDVKGNVRASEIISDAGVGAGPGTRHFYVSFRANLYTSAAGKWAMTEQWNLTNFTSLSFGTEDAYHPALLISNNGSSAQTNALLSIGNGAGTVVNMRLNVMNGTNYYSATNHTFEGQVQFASYPSIQSLTETNNNDGTGTNYVLDLNWSTSQLLMTNHVTFLHATNGPASGYVKFRDITIINDSGANYMLRVPTGWTNTVYSPAAPLTITNGTQISLSIKARGGNTPITYKIQ